ncbi:MAG: response regulator [Myxococcota bacterium]
MAPTDSLWHRLVMDRDTILIVDDEPDVRIFLSTVLEDHGFRTLCAENGEHGLALARAEKPALICLDVAMPHATGVKMYRVLRTDEALKKIPVVMVTGMPQQFERFIKSRRTFPAPEGYVPKPFVPHAVLVLIQQILRERRSVN